jgi:hypothetical protein
MGSLRERHRPLGPLLDEQDGHAPIADRREGVEHDVDELRREPQRRLVEQENPRAGCERPRNGELLLLTA